MVPRTPNPVYFFPRRTIANQPPFTHPTLSLRGPPPQNRSTPARELRSMFHRRGQCYKTCIKWRLKSSQSFFRYLPSGQPLFKGCYHHYRLNPSLSREPSPLRPPPFTYPSTSTSSLTFFFFSSHTYQRANCQVTLQLHIPSFEGTPYPPNKVVRQFHATQDVRT